PPAWMVGPPPVSGSLPVSWPPPSGPPVWEGRGERPAAGSRAVFRTSRLSALVWGGVTGIGALVCGAISRGASESRDRRTAFLFFVGCVLLGVPAVRMLWTLARSRRGVEVSGQGLTVGRGPRPPVLP